MERDIRRSARSASCRLWFLLMLPIVLSPVLLSVPAQAYDFTNVCPTQPPPKWTAEAWTQFRSACIANNSARDRRFFDRCMTACAVADQDEGIKPKVEADENAFGSGRASVESQLVFQRSSLPGSPAILSSSGRLGRIRQACINTSPIDSGCIVRVRGRAELWERQRTRGLNSPRVLPDSTDKPQGPFSSAGRRQRIYSAPTRATEFDKWPCELRLASYSRFRFYRRPRDEKRIPAIKGLCSALVPNLGRGSVFPASDFDQRPRAGAGFHRPLSRESASEFYRYCVVAV